MSRAFFAAPYAATIRVSDSYFLCSVGGAESNPHNDFSALFLLAPHPMYTDKQHWPSRDVARLQPVSQAQACDWNSTRPSRLPKRGIIALLSQTGRRWPDPRLGKGLLAAAAREEENARLREDKDNPKKQSL
jgi:hypothetical protein